MTEYSNKCTVCDGTFVADDEVILVNDTLYHSHCVEVFPVTFAAFIDGECLGETQNDDGSLASDYLDDL